HDGESASLHFGAALRLRTQEAAGEAARRRGVHRLPIPQPCRRRAFRARFLPPAALYSRGGAAPAGAASSRWPGVCGEGLTTGSARGLPNTCEGAPMSAQIKLTVRDGIRPERQYTFSNHPLWTVGGGVDCQIHIPNDELHGTVSRHHCQLEIDPPRVRVRDLGSKNGTYVNGRKLGVRRDVSATPAPAGVLNLPELALRPGDEIQVGNTVLEVTSCTTDRV